MQKFLFANSFFEEQAFMNRIQCNSDAANRFSTIHEHHSHRTRPDEHKLRIWRDCKAKGAESAIACAVTAAEWDGNP